MVYNITGKSFAAAKFVIPLFLLIVLLTLGVLTVTFIGKLRPGGFSYSMVFIGGVILFLLVSFIVIMLILGKGVKPGNLGTRTSFADIAATVTELLGVEYETPGRSFAKEII